MQKAVDTEVVEGPHVSMAWSVTGLRAVCGQ